MNTATYSYGETPEAVISERHSLVAARVPAAPRSSVEAILRASDAHLLTVLDALKQVTSSNYDKNARGLKAILQHEPNPAARKLRIDILAALGINEGGE